MMSSHNRETISGHGDVIHALQGVQSIIMVPEDDDQPVRLVHTSLRDFFTTQARSQHLFVNSITCHLSMATDCLSVMTAHHGDIIYESKILQYAAQNWCHHLLSTVKEGDGGVYLLSQDDAFMNTLISFLSGSFDPWMNSIIFQVQIEDIGNILDSLLQPHSLPLNIQRIIRKIKTLAELDEKHFRDSNELFRNDYGYYYYDYGYLLGLDYSYYSSYGNDLKELIKKWRLSQPLTTGAHFGLL